MLFHIECKYIEIESTFIFKILLLFSLDRDLRKRGGMIELPLGVFSWARSFDAN